MTLRWKPYYRPILDGTQVRASVTNVPVDDLWQNMLYLKDAVDRQTATQALVIYDQTIAVGAATPGTPVYLDSLNIWQPAIAELSSNPNSSLYTLTDRSYVAGVVLSRSSTGQGSIAIQGQVTLSSAFAAVLEGPFVEGILYLSPYTPGRLTSSKGVAPVRVGLAYGPDANGDYRVIVNPDQKVQLESHGHYHFTLVDRPAGEANCVPGKEGFMWGDLEPDGPYPGVVHEVRHADSSLPGWLPVSDAAFTGMTIPAGAVFGYNIAQDAALAAVWPPLPLAGVDVEVDGVGEVGDLIELNSDGIWWMDDSYGKAPWPVNLPCPARTGGYPAANGSSSSNPDYPIWPVRIDLWFSKTLSQSTLETLNNQIEVMTAAQSLIPIQVGGAFTAEFLAPGVHAYALAAAADASSSSTMYEKNAIIYTLDTRDFTVVGQRTPLLAFEIVIGGNDSFASAASAIVNGTAVSVTRMLKAADGEYASFAPVHEQLTWDVVPTDLFNVPFDQYFVLRTEPMALTAGEILTVKLTIQDTYLTGPLDKIHLYAVRPVVTIA